MVKVNRRKRRLTIIAVALAALMVGAGAGYVVLKKLTQQRYLAMRDAGQAAFVAGDYETAMEKLRPYCGRNPTDADTLFQLAEARRRVEAPNRRHLVEALGLYRRFLQLRPERVDVLREVMRLHWQLGYRVEAVDAATKLLEAMPGDPEAVLTKARGLVALRKNTEAITLIEAAVKKTPLDAELQLLLIRLYADGTGKERVLPHAQALLEAHRDDGRAELLLGAACLMTAKVPDDALAGLRTLINDRYPDAKVGATSEAIGRFLVMTAVQRPLDDLGFARALLDQVDQMRMPLASLDILKRAVAKHADRDLRILLIHRLYEAAQFAELEKLTATPPAKVEGVELQIMALRAIALVLLDRKAEIQPLVEVLAKRTDEPMAMAWAAVLREVYLADAADKPKLIAAIKPALEGQRRNPYLQMQLASAYQAIGEREAAVEACKLAIGGAPLWPIPIMRLADLLVEQREYAQALDAARYAASLTLSPLAMVQLASIWASTVDPARLHQEADLVKLVELIQQQIAQESQTLPLHVRILAQSGQAPKAIEAIKLALDEKQKPAEATLLRLAAVSRDQKLGLEEACYARIEQLHGMTPQLAMARSGAAATAGQMADGLKLLEQLKDRQPQPLSLQWRAAWTEALDKAADPRAADAVRTLVDDPALAADLRVQRLALAAQSVQGDRAFLDRTIDRMKAITGDDASGWRLARARILVRPGTSPTDLKAAVELLTPLTTGDMLEIRQLLGIAQQRLGNLPAAIEHFAAALKLKPDSAPLTLTLAMLYQSSADYARAREQLERIHPEQLTDDQCRQLASLLMQQGQPARALAIIQGRPGLNVANDRLMQAVLLERQNQPRDAEALYRELLKTPDVPVIATAARFFAATRRPDEAEKTLQLLAALQLRPGEQELVRADYYAATGEPAKAISHARAATDMDGTNASSWRLLILQCLRTGQVDDAIRHAADAAKAAPKDKMFAALDRNRELVRLLAAGPTTRTLVQAVVADSSGLEAPWEALAAVGEVVREKLPPAAIVEKLRPVAELAPRLVPLQVLLMQVYLEVSKPEEAIKIADRTLLLAPASSEAAEVSVRVRAALNDWRQVLTLAQRWRELILANPLPADLFISEAQLQLDQPAAAAKQIEPHLAAAQAKPEEGMRVLAQQSRIWIKTAQAARAADLLWPIAQQSAPYRQLWIELALSMSQTPETAAAWLARLEDLPPPDTRERIAVVNAWHALSVRTGDNRHLKTARASIGKLAALADAPIEVTFTQAFLAAEDKDYSAAEQVYRGILKKNPGHVLTQNNLAMVLLDSKGSADEAAALAAEVVKAHPQEATFHDTLASAHTARKDWPQAIAAMSKACALAPNDPKWPIRLAALHADAGQLTEAARVLKEFTARFPDEKRLNDDLRDRLTQLRIRISAAPR